MNVNPNVALSQNDIQNHTIYAKGYGSIRLHSTAIS